MAGVSAERLRRTDLHRPFRGVRVPTGTESDLRTLCRAALAVLPAGSAVAESTALTLLGVELPTRLASSEIHVRVPSSAVRPARAGIVVHASTRVVHLAAGLDIPVVAAEEAWLDCAARADVDTLVVLGDALLRRQQPAAVLDELKDIVARTPPGTRGIARLRAALSDVRPGTDSLMETRTRLLLVRSGLPEPRVNRSVQVAGRFIAMPDLIYEEAKIAIEYDGDIHRTDRATWMRDIRRREQLQAAGWLVLTATADDVLRDPAQFVRRVRTALNARTR